MVNGHELTPAATLTAGSGGKGVPCVVVDLDGTLIRANSFRLFIRFLAARLRRRGGWGSLAEIAGLLAARRLRLISHVRMKHPIHLLALRLMSEADIDEFTDRLLPYINIGLLDELRRLQGEGWVTLLATAAPDFYIPSLCRKLGFDAWTATAAAPTLRTYEENRSARKRDRALSLALGKGWRIAAVATDHPDDLPLLRLPDIRRMLVCPAPELRQILTLPFEEFR